MNSLSISAIVFLCTLLGTAAGMALRNRLPGHHLNKESQDVIRLGTGLIGSMAALVLGLLVAAATAEFNNQKSGFQSLATNLVLLDRALGHYGPDAQAARTALRNTTELLIERFWPSEGTRNHRLDTDELTASSDKVYQELRALKPTNDVDRTLQSQALSIGADLGKTRWQLSQTADDSLPRPFLVVLTFWLTTLFLSFGLFAPRNPTVLFSLVLCALSVSGAVFLIVDLDQPFEGLIQISSGPLRGALAQLGK
jgi:hypothetical protein